MVFCSHETDDLGVSGIADVFSKELLSLDIFVTLKDEKETLFIKGKI